MTDAEGSRPGRSAPERSGSRSGGARAEPSRGDPGRVAGVAQEIIAQLRGIAEGLESLTRVGEHLPATPGSLPLPGTLSAAQLTTITDAIAAQRRSIEALKAQLSSFDEQLAVLEQIVRPLAEWSSRWAELESRLVTLGRGRPGGKGRDG